MSQHEVINAPSSQPKQIALFKNQIILNPSISIINYISFNLCSLLIIFLYVSVDILQPILLSDPKYYNVSAEDLPTVNSTILVWDMLIKIVLAPFYGIFCDKIGRKPVAFIGLTSMCIGLLLLPFVGQGSVFPNFIFARAIFANGAIACIIVPLLADYVDYETKGRASGILVVLAGCGALLSSSYCLSLTQSMTIGQRYVILAVGSWVIGCIIIAGLKGGKYHKELNDPKAEIAQQSLLSASQFDGSVDNKQRSLLPDRESTKTPAKKGFMKNLSIGFEQAKNPWVCLGYIMSFLSRGETGVLTFSLVIWCKYFFPSDPHSQMMAEVQSYILSGIAYTVLMVTALFFGFIGDKFSKFKTLIVVYASTAIGIVLLVASSGPKDTLAYISMIFIGLGVAGYQTFSLQFVNKYADMRYRGSVNAVSSLFGVVGLIIISILGGYLMGININACFYMFLGFSMVALLFTSILYTKSEVLQKL